MKTKLLLTFLVLGYFLSGCATALTDGGEQVILVEELNAQISEEFRYSGIITCQKEQNLASVATNRKNCENELRNKAADHRADLVVIDSFETFPGTATVGVYMIGHTYVRR